MKDKIDFFNMQFFKKRPFVEFHFTLKLNSIYFYIEYIGNVFKSNQGWLFIY